MNFLPQLVSLLTETPGNVIYLLVTLFALQAVFAIAANQWLRDKDNGAARRNMIASGALIIGRIIFLAAGLLLAGTPERGVTFLPPFEQSLNTFTAVFIVWALTPPFRSRARLLDAILMLSLLILGLLTISFTIAWQEQILADIAYVETPQAQIWLGIQIFTYSLGLILVLANRFTRNALNPVVLAILLAAAIVSLLSSIENSIPDTHILFWSRLGYLFAFPLWAVLTYRLTIIPLVTAQQANAPPVQQLASAFIFSGDILHSFHAETRIQQAIYLVQQMVDAAFVGIGVISAENKQIIEITSNIPQGGADSPRRWRLDLVEWAPFRSAIRKKQGVELRTDGRGTRHLHVLYDALDIGSFGTMLVEPMFVNEEPFGMLLLAKPDGRSFWSDRDKTIAPALASFIAQAILNSYSLQQSLEIPIINDEEDTPFDHVAVSGRLITLEEERDRVVNELETATNRALQAEARAVLAMKKAHDLALTLEEFERIGKDDRIQALEKEIETLRESLIQAEEAMALAAASEGDLSAEWVMLTITRYSGLLEKAQLDIENLERELARRESGTADELLVAMIQELRTPMTSIGGFSDLLLGETMGILGSRQRDLLQRIQANSERLGTLLDQILQLVAEYEPQGPIDEPLLNVRGVIESAMTGIMTQVRDKDLWLDLSISEDLPPLKVRHDDFHQILSHLLGNACHASGNNGRVIVKAQTDTLEETDRSLADHLKFLQIDVTDSGGGIHPAEIPSVFTPHHRADAPLIKGLGETGAGLSVAQNLAIANGGRIWVNSDFGDGSTFTLLFPVTNQDGEDRDSGKANGAVQGPPH